MGFEYVSKLPTPDEIRAQFPLAPELAAEKARKDAAIRDVFTGDSDKFLVIIGPCSADREDAVIDYVNRLAKVQEKVKDKLILVPRIYTNKPRTTGDGYKGLLHQPNPEGKPNLYQGLIAIRKLHMRVIEETGFSTADEMLYPENLTYLSDVMSYVAVGARSVENQQHRLVASGIDVPVGMKNPTSGALSVILLLISGNNRLDTLFQILLGHGLSSHPNRPQRRLIDNVCQLRAARTVGGTGDLIVIHTLIHFNLFAMDFQNCLTAFQIRQLYRNPAVKTSRTKQRRIEGFRTVGRRQNDNTLLTVKTIHLSQKLVQRLLALVIAAHAGAVTLLTNRIDLVDKYDTRRFFIGLFK